MTFLADASYTVPSGVTSVLVEARAGGGGGTGFFDSGAGAQGAWVGALVPVQPGDVLTMAVGAGGTRGGTFGNGITHGGLGGDTVVALNGQAVVVAHGTVRPPAPLTSARP